MISVKLGRNIIHVTEMKQTNSKLKLGTLHLHSSKYVIVNNIIETVQKYYLCHNTS